MSDDSRSTLKLTSPGGSTDQIDILRSLLPADWQPIHDAEGAAFEGDLGSDLPRLRVEETDEKWVGILYDDQFDREPRTDVCDSLNAAALHLGERLYTYGKKMKERGERIIEKSRHDD